MTELPGNWQKKMQMNVHFHPQLLGDASKKKFEWLFSHLNFQLFDCQQTMNCFKHHLLSHCLSLNWDQSNQM